MARVFISHRSADVALAERLAEEIKADPAGHLVWLDASEIRVGDEIAERISVGLEAAEYVVACFSSHGLAPWMSKELWAALARQLNGLGVKVLPVLLSGGAPPALLGGTKYADLAVDWDGGVRQLLRAME